MQNSDDQSYNNLFVKQFKMQKKQSALVKQYANNLCKKLKDYENPPIVGIISQYFFFRSFQYISSIFCFDTSLLILLPIQNHR